MKSPQPVRRLSDRLRLRFDPLYAALREAGKADRAKLPELREDLRELVERCENALALELFERAMLGLGLEYWSYLAAKRRWEIDPTPIAAALFVERLIWVRRYRDARATIDGLSQVDRDHPSVQSVHEQLLTAEGKLTEARLIAKSLDDAPEFDSPSCAARHVEAIAGRGRYEDARELGRRAAERWPEHDGVRIALARMMYIFGDVEGALEHARSVLSKRNRWAPGAANLGIDILYELGRYHEALNRIAEILQDQPEIWTLYSYAFQAATLAGRPDEYDALTDDLIRREPHHPDALGIIALKLAAEDKPEEAAAYLERIRRYSEQKYFETAVRVAAAPISGDSDRAIAARARAAESPYTLDGADILLAVHLYFDNGRKEALDRALDLVEGLIGRWRHVPSMVLMYVRLLVAQDRLDAVREEMAKLPAGIRKGKFFRVIDLYLLAKRGQHDAASAGWARLIYECRDPAANAPTSYPETVALKWREKPGDILLFCFIFNGMDYIEWLVAYYRSLGVDHFFFTDNGSTDGTFEFLEQQPDVSLFHTLDSFARACCGVVWNNHNLRRFGRGHWCIHVDMDEAFVFPGQEAGRDLKALTRYLDANGYGTVQSTMIDIYPESFASMEGRDPFEASRWIDSDYPRFPSEFPPYENVYGGVRVRLAKSNLLLTKAPLLKVTENSWYLMTNHTHTHAPVADLSTALLHYKFVGDFAGRVREAIDREEHFLGAGHYKALQSALDAPGQTLKGPGSVEYRGPKQLVELGLVRDSELWRSRQW